MNLRKHLYLAMALVAIVSVTNVAYSAVFDDDFEAYPVSDPADFSATGNWLHNGVGGAAANANRMFTTGNFGGSTLWISHPTDFLGSGIDSRGIDVQADTEYVFSANIVAETSNGLRDNEFAVDLLVGQTLGAATSVLGGPQTVIGRGDHDDSIAGSIDDSYEDQVTTISFNSGAVAAEDQLFISIDYIQPGPSGNPGFAGVDNVSIAVVPEPSTAALLGVGLLGVLGIRRKRRIA